MGIPFSGDKTLKRMTLTKKPSAILGQESDALSTTVAKKGV